MKHEFRDEIQKLAVSCSLQGLLVGHRFRSPVRSDHSKKRSHGAKDLCHVCQVWFMIDCEGPLSYH